MEETKGKCEHSLRRVYYRRTIEGLRGQQWVTAPNKFYCIKCREIIEVE